MNKSYRSLWSQALGAWVAVSEITHTRGKRGSGAVVAVGAVLLAVATAAQAVDYADGSDDGASYAAPVTLNSLGSGTATQSGVISDTGGITKTGSSTRILSADNTYTGGTDLNAGALQVTTDAKLGAASGGLTFDGGTLRLGANGFTSARAFTLGASGGTVAINDTTAGVLGGQIAGAGKLSLTNSGINADEGTRLSLTNDTNS